MSNLTDADKVLRNDTGISIANRLSEIAATLDSQGGTSLAATDIADLYDNTKTYIVGDYVINNQALYRCIEDITAPEDFDSTKWRAIKIMSAVNEEIEAAIDNILPVDTAGPSAIASFTTGLALPLVNCEVGILATGGNGTPDNPNPIVGYSSANITRCGVNLWDEEWEVGNINASGVDSPANDRIRSKGYIYVKDTTSLYIVIPTAVVIHKYGVDKSYLGNNYVASSGSFSIASDVAYIRFRTDTSYGTTYNNDISINYPATDTNYHAYNGNTVTIAFGQTVYGGVLDVTRGKLHVTWGSVDLGSLNYYYSSTYQRFSSDDIQSVIKIPPNDNTAFNGLCSIYTPVSRSTIGDNNYAMCVFNTGTLAIRNTDYSDANVFKTAMNGIMLAHELATPFDIDLTPVQISALVGVNNVFADTNGNTTVKFKDSIQNYIDKKVSI